MPHDDSSSEPDEWQVTEAEGSDDDGSSSDGESIGSNDTDATDVQSVGSASADDEATSKDGNALPIKFVQYAVDKEAEDDNKPLDALNFALIGGIDDAACSVKTQTQPPLPTANELYVKVMNNSEEDKPVMRGIATVHKGQTTVYVLDTAAADEAAIKALMGKAYKETLLCAALATKALSWNNGKDELSLADKKRFRINKGAQMVLSTLHAKTILAKPKPKAKRKRPTAAAATSAETTPKEKPDATCDSAEKPMPKVTRKRPAKPRQLFQGKLKVATVEKPTDNDNSTPAKRRRTTPKPHSAAGAGAADELARPIKDTGFTDAEMHVLKKIAGFVFTL